MPLYERRRRMPSPNDDPMLTNAEQMKSSDLDHPLLALILGFRYELPDGELVSVEVGDCVRAT